MRILKCDKCGGYYKLKEGESIDDFDGCECGGNFKGVDEPNDLKSDKKQISGDGISERLDTKHKRLNIKEYESKFCMNCGTKLHDNSKYCEKCGQPLQKSISKQKSKENEIKKPFLIIGGLLGLLIILVVVISVIGSSSTSAILTPDQIEQQAISVTAAELYSDNGSLIGKPVKMEGELIDTGSSTIRVKGIDMSSGYNLDDHDVLVTGNFGNVTAYERDDVYVYGVFKGSTSYKTVMGAERTVPSIGNAWIETTGNSFN